MRIYKLDNPVQRYAWGSRDGIASALGVPNPGGGPFAELWMGAHPSAPSQVEAEGRKLGLDELIAADPEACLGSVCVERFGRELPFLFKALSAGSPLSIQAHPGKRKAELGFERENLSGIPVDAPERNYRDPNHKPEASVALTRLELLCGFRPIAEIIENVRALGSGRYSHAFDRLERNPGRAELSVLFYGIVSAEEGIRHETLEHARRDVEELLASGGVPPGREGAFRWVLRLMELFPGDIGALAPLVLNLVEVETGQSVAIAPGELHAYLSGTCLELMANSDNVIRGALTGKHVDLPELVSVLSFNPERVRPVGPEPASGGEECYPLFVPDFQISRITLRPGEPWERRGSGPEILLCAQGEAEIAGGAPGSGGLRLARGESAFAAADSGRLSARAEGGALLYRAFVPEIP
ncbi:MAG TPA: mannose-6-phosphate isomerase, class I [Spirochaetia bacterium]|nr:mannose-6-phosphate isomerase, class I [Spirochaetia bacterium]